MQSHSQWHIHTTGLCLPHAADKPQLFSLPPSLFAHCLLSFVALRWALFDVDCWLEQMTVAAGRMMSEDEKGHAEMTNYEGGQVG